MVEGELQKEEENMGKCSLAQVVNSINNNFPRIQEKIIPEITESFWLERNCIQKSVINYKILDEKQNLEIISFNPLIVYHTCY